jgi:hypothetical protein
MKRKDIGGQKLGISADGVYEKVHGARIEILVA